MALNPFERQAAEHVATPGADIAPEQITPASEDARRARNLIQWQQSFKETTDPKAREVLLTELKRGAGIDFPNLPGGVDYIKAAYTEELPGGINFSILGTDAGPKHEPSLKFSILTAPKAAPMPPAQEPDIAVPGERAVTPGGAVTGRTQVPPPRFDARGPASTDTSMLGRVGVETATTFLGGSLGALGGGAVGGPPGAVVGMRAGETVGAFAGSLLSETFDPSKHPIQEATKAAGITLGTGLIASGATGIARKLIGKPHEGGQELIRIMAQQGKVPLPGAVLESEFIRNTQSFGSAAFGTNELLKKAQAEAEDITSNAIRQYVSGFQRYHDSAKTLFADVDHALANPLPTSASGLSIKQGVPAGTTIQAPGAKWMLKGDEKARDAMIDVINNWVNRTGRSDAMPSALQKMHAWASNPNGPRPTFTFEETQQVYDALFNKARALDFAARKRDVTEIAGTNTAAYIREQAVRVKKAFDDQIDAAISNRAIDPDTKVKLQAARANWNLWVEGQELERMITAATKDVAGNGTIKGSKLIGEIDKLEKLDKQVGTRTISKSTVENLRRYALAAEAVEKSGKQGAFVLAGRVGQLVGLTGMAAGGPLAAVASFPVIAPHIIAWTFANPTASALLIRGLKLSPGSAQAARLGRELLSLWEKEGLVGTERVGDEEQ